MMQIHMNLQQQQQHSLFSQASWGSLFSHESELKILIGRFACRCTKCVVYVFPYISFLIGNNSMKYVL